MENYIHKKSDLPELENIGFIEVDDDENLFINIKSFLEEWPDAEYIMPTSYNNYDRCGDYDYSTVELTLFKTKQEN